jgi:uncharacterized membrane protein YkvA (DUF1232 family)
VAKQAETPDTKRMAGLLSEIAAQFRLVWRLLNDRDVPVWVKFIPPFAILYIISPIDLMPDPVLGLGQLDDLAVLMLGLKLFVEMSPRSVVQRHRDELEGNRSPVPDGEVVDGSYRVIDEE